MSFEGHYERLCENGHLIHDDVYSDSPWAQYDKDWKCPICLGKLAWWNLADQTNGEGKETALKEKEPAEYCVCKCGHRHQIKPGTWRIPRKGVGQRVNEV